MTSASGSFEDFMAAFVERHPNWFGGDSRPFVAVKAPTPKVEVEAPEKAVSVAPVASVDDGWDAVEEVEVEGEQDEYWK